MNWYRFSSDSGGGHQSHHETYKWFEGDPKEADLHDEWDVDRRGTAVNTSSVKSRK